jgi:16S rRNA (adenine1518-N6/adenine1519-N6)-dimethyltransferase
VPHRPRKRFGQNFLHDPGVIARIVAAVAPRPGEHLVEIGPGQGAITAPLLAAAGRLDALELDRDLTVTLRERFPPETGFRLHETDALRFPLCALQEADERLRLVGNLPYNISTPLLFHLLDYRRCIADMHFMLQKEVVDRMAAVHGSRTYGRLSVMLQVHCRVTALFSIGPGAFRPAPKVDSAIVRLVPYVDPPWPVADAAHLYRLVAAAFGQRRKTLRNNLKGLVAPEDFAAVGIDPGERPEQLAPAQFVALANATCIHGSEP